MRQSVVVVDHAEVLAAEADGAREDDLRVDAALVEHLEAHLRVVGADVDLVDRPLVAAPMSALSFLPSRPMTAAALACPSTCPSNTHVGLPSTSSTRGTRSLYFGRRDAR